jgi:drug/metabolite transporter (DMT)-like permease
VASHDVGTMITIALASPSGEGVLPGVLLASLAAVLFALGSVLQHAAAAASAADGGLHVRVMVRRPTWVAGQLCTLAGSGLQVAALAMAPVSVVQPLLATGLVVALGVRSILTRRPPTATELLGACLTGGGLVAFLLAAQPVPGAPEELPGKLSVLASVVVAVTVVVLATCVRRSLAGAIACGISGGLAAGVAAVLISSALKIMSQQGVHAAVTGPELWGAVITAVAAQIGAQQAYARGALTWSLPALTLCDPLAAVPSARYLLGERLTPGHVEIWLPAAVVAAVGVAVLARSGPETSPARGTDRPPGSRPA